MTFVMRSQTSPTATVSRNSDGTVTFYPHQGVTLSRADAAALAAYLAGSLDVPAPGTGDAVPVDATQPAPTTDLSAPLPGEPITSSTPAPTVQQPVPVPPLSEGAAAPATPDEVPIVSAQS